MYKPSGGGSPPNARETSSLPSENSTWHKEPYNRDPRTDRTDRDRVGAGKRHWNGDRSSNMTSFRGITSGASLSGNGFIPRSKPRFQGHYSGFFAETGRNGPSFSATGPIDTGLVRRFHRNPNPSGTSPAAKSQGFSLSAGVDYRASDTEERHNRDQLLPSGDDKEGRDQPLPPHTPQGHSDSPLLRNGDRARALDSRNWEYSPRNDRDNLTRPHGNADLYSSSRRKIVTQFDSGKDWGVGVKRSEVARFERYGNGSRDGPRANYEGSNKDTGFSHGWRRERGNAGVTARHSSFTAGSRNLGELGGRGFLSVGSAQNALHASTLSSNQDFDQPSPSKRPRLGWGQGLAKYEKKVDDVSPSVEKPDMQVDGEGDTRPTVEEVEEKRGLEKEKFIVSGWEHEYKQPADSFIDVHERRGESKMMTILIEENGVQEVSGQDACSCAFLGDSLRRRGDGERKPALAQELQGLKGKPASLVEMEDNEKNMRGGRDEKRGAIPNGNEELELHGRNPASPVLAEDSESRRIDDDVASGVLRKCECMEGKDQNLTQSVSVEEPETRQREIGESSALVEKSEDVLGGIYQNASLVEPLNNARHDFSISDTLTKVETRGDISSSSTSVTECETDGRGIEATVPFSPTPYLQMNAEDRDAVSPIEASPEISSTGCEKHGSPRSHVVDGFLTAPATLLLGESFVFPASSPNHRSTSEFSSKYQYDEQDVTDMSLDVRPLEEAEVLEEPGKNTFTGIKITRKEILLVDPDTSHVLVREEKINLGVPEPVSAVLRTELTIAQVAVSSDPFMSQVREQVVATTKSDTTLSESEPASDGSLVTENSTVYTCVSDVDHAVPLDSARQTEKSILETVERVEAEIDLVKKEIAQISLEISGDAILKISGTHDAGVSAPDSPEYEDVSNPMEEDTTESLPCSVHTRVMCYSSQSSPTAISTRLEKSPIFSERDIFSTPSLLLRESSTTHMPEKEVLELVPGGQKRKSASFDKDCEVKYVRGARSGSISPILGAEELDYFENQFGNEVATGGSSLQDCNQTMIEFLMMENKERARLSGVPLVNLLPQTFAGTIDQQLYHSPIEAPVWQHNLETHNNIHDRLLEKISERRHFIKFKECVLTLRYRALKEAWKQKHKGLYPRRSRPKPLGRWDSEGRSGHAPPSQRSSWRLRPLRLDRLDAESDAALAMKTLMKTHQVEAFRPILKMPAMILDEKERAVRRFVSRNALVEDPIAVEMERKILNPWTAEERNIFVEKFAVHYKNFKEIASYLQHKTTADCVEYYYRNQKSEDFGKSQHGIQLKNRWDYTKTSSTFLTPISGRIKRNHEANRARVEALTVANMNMKSSQSNSQLQVSEHANLSSDPFTMPSNVEMPKFLLKESKALEVAPTSGATMETATSSLISTPCSVSSTAAPLTDQYKEKDSVRERMRTGPSTTRSSYSEQHPAGMKGTRSTYLRRISSRAAAQEQDSQWTDGERELFTNAVVTYGKDFRLIALHVGTKNQNQCKAFFSKTRKRLCLDDLVEQFQANEAAAMLVQSFRHDAGLAQEVKLINTSKMDASAGGIAEELIDTAAAVSTLESLKEQSKCLANDMSDLSLVADAAAVMEEIMLVKPEVPTLDLFSSGKSRISSQELASELLKVNRSNFTVPFTLLREEEDEDSEATKSDGSYVVGTEAETDIVVDQAAAALIGMSETLADKSGSNRSKSEAKFDSKSFPISFTSRAQSARLLASSPPLPAVTEAKLCLTSGRIARHAKQRVNATIACKLTTRDRPQDMHDAHGGRKGRETAGGEPKPRREPTSWTQEEKEKFAVILQEHGKDWALLHDSLPSKSLTQIKTYFQNSKARSRLPASDKLLTVVRNDGAHRKRKADELESTGRDGEMALPVKQKVRANVAPPELDSATEKEDTLLASASVSATAGVGVDTLAYAARFGTFSGQPADQDSSSMLGMQHLVRQMVSTNTYAQGSTQDEHQLFRHGARSALPSSVVTRPHTSGGIQQLLSGPGPSKPVGSDLQPVSPGVIPQVGPPAAIHQVAQQVQQMLQQQQHLQKQLNLLIQQQAALPPQLLPQHQQVTQQTLQAVRPLEEKLHQVVQQLQQQYELQERGQASRQEEEGLSRMGRFPHQQITPARGILKVKPIRGVVSKPLVDLATTPSSGVLPNQAKSQNKDIQLQQQRHPLSLGIGTISTVTAGSVAGVQESHAKAVDLQDSDTDTDCEGAGSRLMVMEDSHQRMSIVHSTSSGQQQNTTQSTTSTLSSDSEQVKSWDVKLFGQSLLSKPPPLPSNLPRSAGSPMQDFLNSNTSAALATVTFPSGTLSNGFRTSESLPSAFGRVGASSIIAGQQQRKLWPGQYGAWSTTSSFQLSGVTERTRKEADSESVHKAVTSLVAQSDSNVLVLAPLQASLGDDEHLDSESGNLSTGQLETDAVIEGSTFIDRSLSGLNGGQIANSEADQRPISALDPTQAPSQMSLPTVLAGHGQWG